MAKELFVRHVSAKATEEDIVRLFSVSGKVTSVHIVDGEGDISKGRCCFVRMTTDDEIYDARATLDGALLHERTILVDIAKPQKNSSRPASVGRKNFDPRKSSRKPKPS